MDMRIHDINVVADLNSHDPTAPDPDEPVEYDGTYETDSMDEVKSALTVESQQRVDYALNYGATQPEPYWTGPWPLLHVPAEVIISACYAFFEIVIDLLANAEIAALSIIVPSEQGVSDLVVQTATSGFLETLLGAWSGPVGILGIPIRTCIGVFDTLSLIPQPGYLQALTILYLAMLALFVLWVCAVIAMVDQGMWTPANAAGAFIIMMISIVPFLLKGLGTQWKAARFFLEKYDTAKTKFWQNVNYWKYLYTVVVIFLKVAIFVTCLVPALYYMSLHVSLYGW